MIKRFNTILYLSFLMVFILTSLVLIPGCEDTEKEKEETIEEKAHEDKDEKDEKDEKEKEGKAEEKETEEEIDYQEVQPNELGEVMILMYHDIDDELGDWKTTREKFREDMERLYEKDFRLVDLMDVVNGNIDIPAGTTPVVLTFDDGHVGQFNLIEEDGEKIVDPDSAAGILLDLKDKYDDFTLAGNFYINWYPEPFGDRDNLSKNLEILTDKGFSVGNHGYAHANLGNLNSPEEIEAELAKMQGKVKEALDGYEMKSLALAFGAWPKNEEWNQYVYSGEHEGTSYEYEAVLNVSWSPESSPFHKDFDPLDLERIKANDGVDQEMDRWLQGYEDNPEKRYVSDGNPSTIAIPEDKKHYICPDIADDDYEIITY